MTIRITQPVLEEWHENGRYHWALYTWGAIGPPLMASSSRTWRGHRKTLRAMMRGYFAKYRRDVLPYTNMWRSEQARRRR